MNPTRRTLLAAAAAAATLATAAIPRGPVGAAAPFAAAPPPGVIRRRVGSVEVTALLDGHLEMAAELFPSADPAELERLAGTAFHKPGPQRAPVNAYLVNTGERLALVDAGAAALFGPELGKLPQALSAAGVAPEQIDTLLITHLHPDHVAGVLTAGGAAAFPNAELVVTEAEHAFWHDDANLNRAPEGMKPFFLAARRSVAAYAGRVRRIAGADPVFGPITAVPLPGHTPGHGGFLIGSDGEALLIWADLVHLATYQFARPDWSIAFDVDPAMAAATRRRVLDQTAVDRMLVAGMHMPFPGFGHVAKEGAAFRFVPAEWPYRL